MSVLQPPCSEFSNNFHLPLLTHNVLYSNMEQYKSYKTCIVQGTLNFYNELCFCAYITIINESFTSEYKPLDQNKMNDFHCRKDESHKVLFTIMKH